MKQLRFNIKCPLCGSINKVDVPLDVLEDETKFSCLSCRKTYVFNIPNTDHYERTMMLNTVANEFGDAQKFELTADYYTIGRKNSREDLRPSLEVLTLDRRMGRIHAVIRKKPNGFTIQNMSQNGICLNQERIFDDKEVFLRDGDKFVLGQTHFIVSIEVWDNTLDY